MFSGDWLSNRTLAGGLSLATLGGAVLFAYLAHRGLERCENAEVKTGYAASDPSYAFQSLPSGRFKVRLLQSTYKQMDCNKPQGEKEYELCQQWRSAKAADQQACVASLQFWVGGFLGILGLGGLIGTVAYTALTAKAASESVDVAAKALVDLERAVVVLKEVHRVGGLVRDPKVGEDCAVITVEWENSGATRTRHFINWATFKEFEPGDLKDGSLPDEFDYPDVDTGNNPASFVLGPKASRKMSDIHIRLSTLERLGRSETRGYLWGWAEYDDIFGNTPRHRTEFCLRVSKVTPPYSASTIKWVAHHHHNGMDDECPPERFRTGKGGVWIEPRRPRIPRT